MEKDLHFARNTVKNWSNSMPSSRALIAVAEYFDVSVDYLLGHSDNPKPHKNPDDYRTILVDVVQTLQNAQQVIEASLGAAFSDFLTLNTEIEGTE